MTDEFNQAADHICHHTSRDVLRSGDVLAVGLDNGTCPVGVVTAVNEDAFRLDMYSWATGTFIAGPALVMWHQVVEFGPMAMRRDFRTFDMDPLAAFQTAWTEGDQ